jgi:hypothetical protein
VRAVAAALAALVAVLASGCGGSPSQAGGPEMERIERSGASFAVPSSWDELDLAQFDAEGLEYAADGPRDEAGGRTRVTLYAVDATYDTIRGYGKGIAGRRPFELRQGRAAGDRETTVPGADGAWRVETSFQAQDTRGRPIPARMIELLAKDGDTEYLLALAGTEEVLARPEMRAILGSFELTG